MEMLCTFDVMKLHFYKSDEHPTIAKEQKAKPISVIILNRLISHLHMIALKYDETGLPLLEKEASIEMRETILFILKKHIMIEKKKLGRKPKAENEKVRTKSVYLTDKEEKQILKKSKTKDLTEALKQHLTPTN